MHENLSQVCALWSNEAPSCGSPAIYDKEVSTFAGTWCLVCAVTGFWGNLVTLAAIPYAYKYKLYGLHRHFYTTTVFILNLSVTDAIYCALFLTTNAVVYLGGQWPFSPLACTVWATLSHVTAFADWMSLALITLSRCMALVHPVRWNRICGKRVNLIAMFLASWAWALILVLPVLWSVS